MSPDRPLPRPGDPARKWTAAVVGGGVAGLSCACAMAEAGMDVQLIERRPYLGGRASSHRHPGVDEVIDNCQHVLFGCCTNLEGFHRRIGVADRIHWTSAMTLIEPGGRRSTLGPSWWLPAPLHGAPHFLSAPAFTRADKRALARAFRALLREEPAEGQENLGAWLVRQRQTPGAINRFWRLVIASALNGELEAIALPYAAKVIRELFLNSAEAGRMGMNTVPMGELHEAAAGFLRQRGARIVCNAAVESAAWDEAGAGWTLATTVGAVRADLVVLALPFEGVARLLPHLPSAEGAAALAAQLARHRHGPICSVHLWFDREITSLEHAALLDREIHWMYNRSRLQPGRRGGGSYLELVISASAAFAALSREAAVAQSVRELAEFFPAVREARLVKSAWVRETRATFSVPPGIDSARPTAVSPWPNLFLAGDWTATGWPSTMESAARSGHLAAEAVGRRIGRPTPFLVPDLKPAGLMRWFGPTPESA